MSDRSKCQNCGKIFLDSDLTEEIDDIFQRVSPGEPMPSGECPDQDCRALCQPTTELPTKAQVFDDLIFFAEAVADGCTQIEVLEAWATQVLHRSQMIAKEAL